MNRGGLTHSSYPLTTPERQTWRAHYCTLLSGDWLGTSLRADGVETVWTATKLYFDGSTGQIKGEGISRWQDQSFPFEIIGAFTPQLTTVELLKSHRGGTVTHLAFAVDLATLSLTGNFANGGICTLQRVGAGGSAVANPTPSTAVAPTPYGLHRNMSGNNTMGMAVPEAPKDLLTFLSYCFADSPGIAAKIHSTLQENEIHEPESLTTLSHEEWKELSVPLGHRSKIKLQLQKYFPHLMKRDSDEPVTGATSPTNAANDVIVAGSTSSSSAYGLQQLNSGSSAYQPVGSHYAPFHASSAASSFSPLPPSQGPNIPIEFLCPISRDLMDDPVICADGHSYDRPFISQWLESKKTSPITNKIISSKALTPNVQLKQQILQWRQQYQR